MNDVLKNADFGFDDCKVNGRKKKPKKPYEQPMLIIKRFDIRNDLLGSSKEEVDNGYGDYGNLGDGDDEDF